MRRSTWGYSDVLGHPFRRLTYQDSVREPTRTSSLEIPNSDISHGDLWPEWDANFLTKRAISSIGAGEAMIRVLDRCPPRYKRRTDCRVETALPWHRLCGRVNLAAIDPAPEAQASDESTHRASRAVAGR